MVSRPSESTARSPHYAQVGDDQVHFPGSYYVLRHLEGSKTVWTNAGDNATNALIARDRQQQVRQVKNLAVKAGVTVVEKDDARHTLLSLKKKWLQKLEARGKRRAIETMTIAIDDFLAVTHLQQGDQPGRLVQIHEAAAERRSSLKIPTSRRRKSKYSRQELKAADLPSGTRGMAYLRSHRRDRQSHVRCIDSRIQTASLIAKGADQWRALKIHHRMVGSVLPVAATQHQQHAAW
jgi:hypothetical protein